MSPAAIKNTNMSSREVRDSGPSLTKFRISRKIFVKVHNTKFHPNPSSGGSADICGRTDRQKRQQTGGHDKGNRRFTRPCELRL